MSRQLQHIKDAILGVADDYEERLKDPEKYKLIPTLLGALDELLGGGLPNPVDKVIIGIGGAYKMGKTALSLQLAIARAAQTGERTGIFALEEINTQTALRVITRHLTFLKRSMFYRMNITSEHIETIRELGEEFGKTNIFITDDVFSPSEIIQIALANKLDLIVVDNLNLVDMPGRNESEKLDNAMKLFIMARNQHGINFIIVYQLNDTGLALGSRTMYRGADMLIQLKQCMDYVSGLPIEGRIEVETHRSRRSGAGKAELAFDGDASRFINTVSVDRNSDEFLEFEKEQGDDNGGFEYEIIEGVEISEEPEHAEPD